MLEGVTLGGVVQLVVEVLVDLARGTVLDQQATENPLTAHPKNLPKFLCVSPVSTWHFSPRRPHLTVVSDNRPGETTLPAGQDCVMCPQFPKLFSRDNSSFEHSNRSTRDVDVLGHTGIGGTLSLSDTTVATNTTGEVQLPSTSTGVHGDGLSDDEAIGDELANRLAGVGVGDLADLVGVQPDLALAAAEDISREALLSSQVDPEKQRIEMSALHFSQIEPRS